jgi:hypothetical protein
VQEITVGSQEEAMVLGGDGRCPRKRSRSGLTGMKNNRQMWTSHWNFETSLLSDDLFNSQGYRTELVVRRQYGCWDMERTGELYNRQLCRYVAVASNALMHTMSCPNPEDSARNVQDLASRFDNVTVNDSEARNGPLDDPYVAFDDAPDISDFYLGITADPFAGDDLRYLFDVYRVAVGNMDGRQLISYEVSITYVTPPRP